MEKVGRSFAYFLEMITDNRDNKYNYKSILILLVKKILKIVRRFHQLGFCHIDLKCDNILVVFNNSNDDSNNKDTGISIKEMKNKQFEIFLIDFQGSYYEESNNLVKHKRNLECLSYDTLYYKMFEIELHFNKLDHN